ncbi:hypothetical protein RUND412_000611 [Rhizina undulata]
MPAGLIQNTPGTSFQVNTPAPIDFPATSAGTETAQANANKRLEALLAKNLISFCLGNGIRHNGKREDPMTGKNPDFVEGSEGGRGSKKRRGVAAFNSVELILDHDTYEQKVDMIPSLFRNLIEGVSETGTGAKDSGKMGECLITNTFATSKPGTFRDIAMDSDMASVEKLPLNPSVRGEWYEEQLEVTFEPDVTVGPKTSCTENIAITVTATDLTPSIGSRSVSDMFYASSTASDFKFPEHTAEQLNIWDNLESLIDIEKKPADVACEN